MDFILAVFVFPALVAALALGAGLLVDRAAGGVPGVLIPPIGLAALITVAELVAWSGAISQLTPVALAVVGLAGYVIGFGQLSEERLAVLAATLFIVGLQIFFSSFLISILGLRRRR